MITIFPIVRNDHQTKPQHFSTDDLLDELLQHEPDQELTDDTEMHDYFERHEPQ